MLILAILLLAFNVLISFMNARAVGLVWHERNAHGGFMWLVIWSAAIQAAIGFSMPLILFEAFVAHGLGLLSVKAISSLLSLWYLAIIVPLLGTGLIITIHSWIVAWRERNFLNMATAAYNTVAMASNVYEASSGIGKAFGKVGELFDSEDANGTVIALVIALVALALAGGALITRAIIYRYAGTLPIPARQAVQG